MKKFDVVKKEFLDFLEFDKGYSERTIENYDRDISKFEIYITEFSINYKKLSKENLNLMRCQILQAVFLLERLQKLLQCLK